MYSVNDEITIEELNYIWFLLKNKIKGSEVLDLNNSTVGKPSGTYRTGFTGLLIDGKFKLSSNLTITVSNPLRFASYNFDFVVYKQGYTDNEEHSRVIRKTVTSTNSLSDITVTLPSTDIASDELLSPIVNLDIVFNQNEVYSEVMGEINTNTTLLCLLDETLTANVKIPRAIGENATWTVKDSDNNTIYTKTAIVDNTGTTTINLPNNIYGTEIFGGEYTLTATYDGTSKNKTYNTCLNRDKGILTDYKDIWELENMGLTRLTDCTELSPATNVGQAFTPIPFYNDWFVDFKMKTTNPVGARIFTSGGNIKLSDVGVTADTWANLQIQYNYTIKEYKLVNLDNSQSKSFIAPDMYRFRIRLYDLAVAYLKDVLIYTEED